MKTCWIALSLVLALAPLRSSTAPAPPPDEFADLQQQIAARAQWDNARLEREVHRREALILVTDRTPVDVVWRRAWALLEHLRKTPSAPDLTAEAAALEALRPQLAALRQSPAPIDAARH